MSGQPLVEPARTPGEIVTLAALIRDVRHAEAELDKLRETRRAAAATAQSATGFTVARATRAVNRELRRLGEAEVSHDTVGRLWS